MGYYESLQKAGAEVLEYEYFGSYQGDWLALVIYKDELGMVKGSYGSCSYCDAFEAEFGYWDKPTIKDGKFYRDYATWDEENECTEEEYDNIIYEHDEKLANFGRRYLEPLYEKSYFENKLAKINALTEDDWFSDEEKEYCVWAVEMFEKHK